MKVCYLKQKQIYWNEERTELAKLESLTIHLNGSNARLNHNADYYKPLVELGHNYTSENQEMFLREDKLNINNLRE